MKIYNFHELKESRLLYDRKPPAFGVIITVITAVLLISILTLAGFAKKTYVVKASSIVSSEQKSYIMNSVSGNIKEIYKNEGDRVSKGEILLQLDTFQVDLQIRQLSSVIAFLQETIDYYNKLISFIQKYNLTDPNSMKNPFDANLEGKWYNDAQQFISYANSSEEGQEKNQSEIDNLKNQFTSQYYQAIDQYTYELITQKSSQQAYIDSLEEYKIRAKSSGIVHYTAAYTVGTVLQAGSLIGSISSDQSDELYFETVISATDRSKIEISDSVEIALSGVLQSEYGVIKGKVVQIDNDSSQTEDGKVFYKVKIKPEKNFVENKRGNKIDIVIGMVAESRIKYDETTWLKWALEHIGIKLR
ncbi:MAG TPA: HlyD family efflux transporter periplasmic adaptor subunit [Tissierellaceae bacterium]|jgi:multidrug efflux pump subunit AcrA (membrane-fusion protein)